MHVTAIIAAGGHGARFGGGRLKQLIPIGGRAMLERSVAAFIEHPDVHEVIVALPQALVDDPPEYLRSAKAIALRKSLQLVAGGARRQDSVANAFRAADAKSDVIVIHDAARPFASADLIARTIAAAVEGGAALAAIQSRDTVKQVGTPKGVPHVRGTDAQAVPYVQHTLARETIYLAQTPQAFRRDVLRDALAVQGDATDEAGLAERAGHPVRIVDGEATNIKITTPEDLVLADAIARSTERDGFSRAIRTGRAGIGYDIHRLVEGRPLILGGVTIPFDRGLKGHSDADALCHGITEAILGAAGAGDIGRHFPDTDPQWKGASSIDLLTRAAAIVRAQGFEIGNVDASVVAERPKLLPYIDTMRANIAAALGVGIDRVSVKGKTNEGLGEIGRGEAIAVHAVALIRALSPQPSAL